jgi:hypothetical protein
MNNIITAHVNVPMETIDYILAFVDHAHKVLPTMNLLKFVHPYAQMDLFGIRLIKDVNVLTILLTSVSNVSFAKLIRYSILY